ncbi:hypothetical protein PENCOP_c004G00647 [Penicillium coprophilum]|uniref:Uncharacterized protein n=1 Tax=Penicillium coprophilum TaxID=36646 RepID=A0A1V6UU90_9EURO|nr:hypothetical protein PENCOP_c004G00647 [Penicillium coprophilum]
MWNVVWPLDEPEPAQVDKSSQTSDLSSKWEQANSGSSSPPSLGCNLLKRSAYMGHKTINNELGRLRQEIKTAKEDKEVLHRGRLFAEEQSRQRGELLKNALQEAKAAIKENRILKTKLGSLQAGTETFSDEEAKRELSLLYHDLEHWKFTHFVAKTSSQEKNDSTPRLESLDISKLDIIQSDIAGLIYRSFWNRFMVGAEHPCGVYLREADSEINKRFPTHIFRHWRCAMSTAMLSLEARGLQEQCNWIIEKVEVCFGRYAVTDRSKRMQQLHDIIARCINLKHKLECQEDTYVFWGSQQYVPFRGDNMRTLVEEDTSDGLVMSSLWPGLWKIIQENEWSIVEKEIVKRIPSLGPSIEMIDDESQKGDTDSDEI